jgi:dolichol-phosphate mannosyltransferase
MPDSTKKMSGFENTMSKHLIWSKKNYFCKKKLKVERSIVIIPTYKEKENIEKIIRYVFNLNAGFNILIIDDNSPDGTADIVRGLIPEFSDQLFLLERPGKLGLGTAYIMGFKWAIENNYSYVFEMDADFSHNPDDLIRLREACIDGADLAIGSRYVSGINVVNWPLHRVLMSYFASKYVRLVTGMKINDLTAGFVCFKTNVLKTIDLDNIRMKGYGFQIEMKFTTWKHGFKSKEVSIIFIDRQQGTSKMSGGIFSEALFGVIKMKWNSFFRKYNKAS